MRIALKSPVFSHFRNFTPAGETNITHSPNAVPIALGTNLNWRFGTTGQKLKGSIGIGGSSANATGRAKDDASDTANLVNARVPKYTARILFLKVIAYTLGRTRISRLRDKINTAYLNVMKMSEENKENMVKTISAWYAAIHLGGGIMSTKNCHLSHIQTPVGSLTQPVEKLGQEEAQSSLLWSGGIILGLTLEFLGPLRM